MPDGCIEAGAGSTCTCFAGQAKQIDLLRWGTKNPGSFHKPEERLDVSAGRASARERQSYPGERDLVGLRYRNRKHEEYSFGSSSVSKPLRCPPFFSRAPVVGAIPHSGIYFRSYPALNCRDFVHHFTESAKCQQVSCNEFLPGFGRHSAVRMPENVHRSISSDGSPTEHELRADISLLDRVIATQGIDAALEGGYAGRENQRQKELIPERDAIQDR